MTTSHKRPDEPAKNRRAAPDVIEKRRTARQFNQLIQGEGRSGARDGRTEKRRQRLLTELSEGVTRGGKRELSPIDVLSRVQALLDLGEPLASIKRACPAKKPIPTTDELVDTVRRLHRAHGFAVAAYPFVGIEEGALRKAGLLEDAPRPLAETKGETPQKPSVVAARARPRGDRGRGVA